MVALVWPAANSDAPESDLDLSQPSNSELKHPQEYNKFVSDGSIAGVMVHR